MKKPCDQTSVGVLVFRDKRLLLLNGKLPPFGLIIPAGHVDHCGNTSLSEYEKFELAGRTELKEETGLHATSMRLIYRGFQNNICGRGGTRHYWHVFLAETEGELKVCKREVVGFTWATKSEFDYYLSGNPYIPENGEKTYFSPTWITWFKENRIRDLY